MTKNAAAVRLAVLGNLLIFPVGFIVFLLIVVWIPQLNNIVFMWLGMIVTALPLAAVFVFMRRRYNSKFEPGLRRSVYVKICALPSFLISALIFWLMLMFDGGADIDVTTIIMAFAAPYSAVCILVISAVLGIECLIERGTA